MSAPEPDTPIFVIGSSRSGTTLLYSFLLASGEFPMYEEGETHLLECARKYRGLHRGRNFERFAHDWFRSLQFKRSALSEEEFLEGAATRPDYVQLLGFFMETMARREGKPRWAEKTPAHVFHVKTLADAFPDARFLHVLRDGRDVALSMRSLGWSGTTSRDTLKQLVCAAKNWERTVLAARRAAVPLGDRYLEVRYEDLVTDTDRVIEKVREFTGADIPRGAESSDVGAFREGFSAFGDNLQGLSKRGVGRWRTQLEPQEAAALDASIGPTLAILGYPIEPVAGSGRDRLRFSLYARFFAAALRTKSFLAERTPLGRLRSSRLELDDEA